MDIQEVMGAATINKYVQRLFVVSPCDMHGSEIWNPCQGIDRDLCLLKLCCSSPHMVFYLNSVLLYVNLHEV